MEHVGADEKANAIVSPLENTMDFAGSYEAVALISINDTRTAPVAKGQVQSPIAVQIRLNIKSIYVLQR